MKKFDAFKTVFFTFLLLIGLTTAGWAQQEQVAYQTSFESADGFAATTTYNDTNVVFTGSAGQQWGTYYGTPSTTAPLSGSQSMQMRWYTTTPTRLGYTYTNFDIDNVSKVDFYAANTLGLNVIVSYSTDGGSTYTGDSTFVLTSNSNLYTYQLSTTGAYENVRIKFAMSLPETHPTATARLYIDDVTIYRMESTLPSLAINSPYEGQTFLTTDTLYANMNIQNFTPGVDGYVKFEAPFLSLFLPGLTTIYCGPEELAFIPAIPITLPAGDYTITVTLVGMDTVPISPEVSVLRNFSFVEPAPELSIISPYEGQTFLTTDTLYASMDIQNFTPGVDGYVKFEAPFLSLFLPGLTTIYCGPEELAFIPAIPITLPAGDYTITVTLVGMDSIALSPEVSVLRNFSFVEPVPVSNIAAFKAANTATNSTIYKITGDVTFVYKSGRNIFVQDSTGGLLIYDNPVPVITNEYEEGDVITGGIYGTYTLYNGLSEMIPFTNPPASTSNNGPVQPVVATVDSLINNYATYESRLVKITGTAFNNPGYTFTGNANTNITQGTSQMVFRNHFGNLTGYTLPAELQSITGFLITFNATRQLIPREESDIAPEPTALPYSSDFETAHNNPNWTLVNGTLTNKWHIGQAQGFDNNKLFISSNNGITNKYANNENRINIVHAYRDIEIPALGGLLSFDYRVMGEQCTPQPCDYLQISLVDVNTPVVAGTLPSTNLAQLNGSNEWKNHSLVLPAGTYHLVFTWVNDQYSGEQYPAAVDNIVINAATCAMPSNVVTTVEITEETATANVSWTVAGAQTNWILEYKLTDHSEWYSVNVTGTPAATLTNLQGNSTYDIRIKADCGNEMSQYAVSTFTTPCMTLIESQSLATVGTGTTYTYYPLPGFYGWQYDVYLYDQSLINAYGSISTIAYNVYSTSTTTTPSEMSIWMKAVPTSFTLAAATTFAQYTSDAVLVYNTPTTFPSTGWNTLPLSTNFTLPEGYSLLVMVRGVGCTTGGGCSKQAYYTSATNKHWYKRVDNSDSGVNAGGALDALRANIRLDIATSVCNDAISCPTPTDLAVANVQAYSVDVTWTAGSDETQWVVEYKQANATDWTVINTNTNLVHLTGLQRITDYVVRVKAICGVNDYSEYTAPLAFTTLATCPTPANFVHNNASNMTIITWDADEETEWISQIKQASQDDNSWTTINIYNVPNATISGLVPNTSYNFRVKAVCSADDQSAWGTFNFTSGCLPFTLPLEEKFTTASLPSCWTNIDNKWTFTSGTARSTSVTPNNFLITPGIELPATGNIFINYDIATSIAADEHYDVMISFRGTNPDNFISLFDETVNSTVLANKTVAIPAEYNGGAVYIAFVHNSAASSATLVLDNVVISACAAVPTQLTSSNITSTSVDLSWTVDAAASQWIVEYSTDGSTWNSVDVTTNPYTLGGLEGNTAYQLRVKTICSDGFESIYSNTVNVRTSCGFYTAPYSESFDTYTGTAYNVAGVVPACWYSYSNNTTYPAPHVVVSGGSYAYVKSAPNAMVFTAGAAGSSTYAVLPEFTNPISSLEISFYAAVENITYGTLYVGYVENGQNNVSSFTAVATIPSSTALTLRTVSFASASIPPTATNIAFHWYHDASFYSCCIDDVVISPLPSCPKPTNIVQTNITTTTADVTWTPGDAENSWDLEYKLASESTWNTVSNLTAPSYTITDLLPATSYSFNVRVKAKCSDTDQSEWATATLSFSTECEAISSLPYTESFDTYATGTGAYPYCWAKNSNYTTTSYPYITTTNYSAPGSLYFYATTAYYSYAITPKFDASIDLSNVQVRFKARKTSAAYGRLDVGVMTDPTDISTFTVVQSIQSSDYATISVWYDFDVSLDTYSGSGKYIAFRLPNEGTNYIYLDDVSVNYIPTCFYPTAIAASNITTTTADLTWTPGDTETSWDLEYKLASESTWNTVSNLTAPSYSITGLLPGTSYSFNVRVKAICSDTDQSEWAETTLSFITMCEAISSLPYTESFDTYGTGTGAYPYCWTKNSNYTSTSYPYINTTNYSAPGSLYFYATTAYYSYAISPEFDASIDLSNVQVNFKARKTSAAYGRLDVGVMTDPSDINTFTVVQSIQSSNYTASNTWYDFEVSLDTYSGSGKYIALRLPNEGTNYIYLDDFSVNYIPTCFYPTAIAASNITTTTADVTWTPGEAEMEWVIQYRKAGTTTWNTVSNITSPNYTLTNLANSTIYELQMKSICGSDDESYYSPIYSFRTLCGTIATLPYTESFDLAGGTGAAFYPYCWSRITNYTTTYPYVSTTYSTSAPASLYFYATTAYYSYAISPEFDASIDLSNVQVNFKARKTSAAYGRLDVGVMTDPTNISTFTVVQSIQSSDYAAASVWYDFEVSLSTYSGSGKYIAFRLPNEVTNYIYLDDVMVDFLPPCPDPGNLSVSNVTHNSADISWTAGRSETAWELEYKISSDAIWTTISVSGTPSYSLSGLSDENNFEVRVRAICSLNDNSNWTDIVRFNTPCVGNSTVQIGESTTTNAFLPFYGGYGYTYSQQIYDASELNLDLSYITEIKFYCSSIPANSAGAFKVWLANTEKSVFADNADYLAPSQLTQVYEMDYVLWTPVVGWNTITFDTPFLYDGTSNLLVAFYEGYAGYSASTFYIHTTTSNKSIAHYSDTQTAVSYSAPATASGTKYFNMFRNNVIFSICPPVLQNEISLESVDGCYDACDLSNLPVTISVLNKGLDEITSFTANYQINNYSVVTEVVNLSTPIASGATYDYTFNTIVNFVDADNTFAVWVEMDGDFFTGNNSRTLTSINLVAPHSVPYTENFTNVTVNELGWIAYDLNSDKVTWTQTNGKLQYTYSDTMVSNDWIITPCINIPAGKYEIAYAYNALSFMPESFSVYMGMGFAAADMTTLISSHPSVVKTASDIVFRDTIIIANDGIYHFGIHAHSLPGNLGITVDNFSITPMIDLNVTYGPNGIIVPNGIVTVPLSSTPLFGIYPDDGFHIKGVFVDGVMVRDEDMQNSRFEFFNYGPVDHAANIHVTFEVSQYNIIASASNYMDIDYLGNGQPAGVILPMDTTVVDFGYTRDYIITPNEHYHLYNLIVDGADLIGDVEDLGNGSFRYDFGRVYAHHTIEAIFKLDTVAIIYNFYSGQGSADGMFADANDVPQVRYTYVDYATDHLGTILPAPGYRVESITVNATLMSGIEQYQFVNIIETQIVNIFFVRDSYTIATAAYGNGTITPGTTIIYDPAFTYTYEVIPATGYHISSIVVNGQPVAFADPAYYTATLSNIHQNYLIEAFFEINTYTIEAVAGNNGSVTPNGTTLYNWGSTVAYNALAETGYYISSITRDGVTTNYTAADNMTSWSYTFANIQANHTLNITFAQFTYTITASADANGTITPTGVTTLPYGGSQTYTITPALGYEIDDVTVDGVSMGAITHYTFAEVTANHTINVTFSQLQYTVEAVANIGGTITPGGIVVYNYGSNATYNATANTGYTISTVTVDGVVSVVNATTWTTTFDNITENHSIYVVFEVNLYTVTVNQPALGTITPETQTVIHGATPVFTVTPNTGYTISTILVDGIGVTFTANAAGVATYTFPAVTANHTLTATFTVKTFTVTATANTGGTITPAGTTTLNYGASRTYTITPAAGNVLVNVMVDGLAVGAMNTYTFHNVTANHTIAAQFALIPCNVPDYLYASDITQNSAILHWNATGAESYTVRYKTLDTTDYTEIPGILVNSIQLNDLNPETYYIWMVKAICDHNESEWAVQSSFTTAQEIGINEANLESVKVYSNLNNVYIVNNNLVAIKQVEIFDIFGKSIYLGTAASNPEVISLMVANGTYIVRLTTQGGVGTYKVNITR